MESEYTAASTATHEAFGLKYLLKELGVNSQSPIIMFEDNKARKSFSEHPSNHRNSKHIDYLHDFVRDGVQRGDIKLVYV